MITKENRESVANVDLESIQFDKVMNVGIPTKPPAPKAQESDRVPNLLKKFEAYRIDIQTRLQENVKKIKSIDNFVMVSVSVQGLRQEVLEDKFKVQTLLAKNNRKMSTQRSDEYINMSTGNNLLIKSQNDKNIYMGSKLSDLTYLSSILTHQIEWFDGTIKGIDSLLWNIKHLVDVEKMIGGS